MMSKPNYYRGKKPLKVSGGTLVKVFGAIKDGGHEEQFAKALDDHKITLDPETVNFLKDFVSESGMTDGDEPHNRVASVVVKSPGGRCPDLNRLQELIDEIDV